MNKTCKYCGKLIEFDKPQQFGGHLTNCSLNPTRINRTLNPKTKKVFNLICSKCGEEYQIELTQKMFDKGNYKKNCSYKCANGRVQTDENNKKRSEKLRGVVSPKKGKICKKWCESDKEKLSAKMKSLKIKHWNTGKQWSPEMRKLFSEQKIEYYKNNPNQHPNRKCAGIKESYPEKMLREYFELNSLKNNIDFIQQFKIDKYYVDFYIPKLNLVIEVDGERWHNNIEKEIIRENIILENHKLIRFKANLLIKKQYENNINDIITAIVA